MLVQGVSYLIERKYQVFANWTENSPAVDPGSIDWQAVRDGKLTLRVRRGPGPGNSMGDIKFMMPNKLGIYLHDSPDKMLFRNPDRWLSNGCVRVEDAHRLAAWLFGAMPSGHDPDVEEYQYSSLILRSRPLKTGWSFGPIPTTETLLC